MNKLDCLRFQRALSNLQKQPVFKLEVNGMLICKYIGDFAYRENEIIKIEDVKSKFTAKLPVYRIKRKLMKAIWNIDIIEV